MTYNTETREKIIEFLKMNKDSFSAEEIYSALSESGASKSTVFRQLARLSQEAEIKRITSESSRSVRYQYVDREHCGSHLHLKCSSCGKLVHLDNDVTEFFEKSIKSSKRFSIDTGAFIPGLCDTCILKGDKV